MPQLEKKDISEASPGRIAEFLAELPRTSSRALLLDYDGTLAPFTADRSQAVPYAAIPALIDRIRRSSNTRVVIISGRRAPEVSRLLGLKHIEVWGCHGSSRLHPDGSYQMPELDEEITRALAEAGELLCRDGLADLLELKPAAIAIHWRGVNRDANEVARKVERLWSSLHRRKGLELLKFDGGLEIRAAGSNKGDAVRTVLREVGGHSAIAYLGDDHTDEDAFAALRGHGLSVLVRQEYRPTHADAWIRPPEGVEAFLAGWAAACGRAS